MSKKSIKDNFIISILVILMIIIILFTGYFILDVFGIIKIPNKYSIASLFYSQIEVIATGGEILTEEIVKIPEKDIIKIENDDSKNKNLMEDSDKDGSTDTQNIIVEEGNETSVQSPLEELERLNKEQFEIQNQLNKSEVEVDNFYYNQLDEYGKIIYDKLYKNLDKLKTGTYTADFDTTFDELLHQENGSDILNNSFQLAINALTFDNPELFYIDITKINLITEIITKAFSTTYKISIGGNGKNYLSEDFSTLSQVNEEIENIENIKNDILRRTGEHDIANLKIVHDYLVNTIEYKSDAGKNVYNIYGALVNKQAVCEGYARAYKLILDELGIPCIIACGLAKNSSGEIESHAWNYVQVENNWYAVDVTWDDPVIIGNGTLSDDIKYRYFLVGSDEFFKDHFEDGNIAVEFKFVYPELMNTNY
ncbi:MAG: hypothetical protein IKL55_02260 [Clostridia bacterium]|nr:hypothetical protein [Clostridia bacterium]